MEEGMSADKIAAEFGCAPSEILINVRGMIRTHGRSLQVLERLLSVIGETEPRAVERLESTLQGMRAEIEYTTVGRDEALVEIEMLKGDLDYVGDLMYLAGRDNDLSNVSAAEDFIGEVLEGGDRCTAARDAVAVERRRKE